MKNKNRAIGSILCLIFIISIFSPFIDLSNTNLINNTELNPKLSTLQFEDDVSETMYKNIDYEFSTVFYDDANYGNIYTDAYLETTHLEADVENNDTISAVDNYFTEYPENENITITNGILVSNGTLNSKDTNSTDIDSTQGGFFNATYTWTDDANGAYPAGWSGTGGAGRITVIGALGGHSKVVEIDDDLNGWLQFDNSYSDQADDVIIEWWYRTTNVANIFYTFFNDDGNRLVYLLTWNGDFRAYDSDVSTVVYNAAAANTLYRMKVVVDWSASQFDYFIYSAAGALLGSAINFDFHAAKNDGFDQVRFQSHYATVGWQTYLDAIDYNWTAGYYEGRNANAEDAIVDITVQIDGLNPHLSLEALEFELYSYYKTNESVNTKFYIYNFTDAGWDLLDNSIHLNFNDIEGVTYQTPTLNKFINASGITLVRYLCESSSVLNFQFSIDQLGVDIWTKLHLSHTRSFDLYGLWKYRWHIVGSSYYSNWTSFDIKESIHNFEAISESEYTTRWVLYSNDTTPTLDFHDDINTNAWTLEDVSEDEFITKTSEVEDYLLDDYSYNDTLWEYTGESYYIGAQAWYSTSVHFYDGFWWVVEWTIVGDTDKVYKYYENWTYTGLSYVVGVQDTFPYSIHFEDGYWWMSGTATDRIYKYNPDWTYTDVSYDVSGQDGFPVSIHFEDGFWWMAGDVNDRIYKYNPDWTYTDVSYDVSGQDDNPNSIYFQGGSWWMGGDYHKRIYKYNPDWSYTGLSYSISAQASYIVSIHFEDGYWWMLGSSSGSVYKYESLYDISKNYYGSGYTYMQTDTTESISLLSSTYATNYTLSSGDYFEVDLQTNSDSQIDLILLRNGVVQKTLTLSPSGNTDFTQHIAQVIIDDDVEFDQLKVSSTFEDIDYVRIYDIKTYQVIITGDSADFYLGSMRSKSIILKPYNYSLNIYEQGIKKVEEVIELTYDILYQYIYQPVGVIESRVSLFSTTGTYLNFNEFRLKINRSLNEEYTVFWLLDTLFFVDTNTEINFTIYDKFNTYINSFIKVAYPFIDLYLEVYFLTIKNIMEEKTTLLLNSTNSYELLSDESIEFILPKGYYQLNWTDELGNPFDIIIYLDENRAYELNSSYFEVYFSLFTYDGFGVNHDFVRFYINNARKDFGFNTLKQDTNNLKILDYFNATLFNSNINLKQFTEYNIFIEIYTMIIFNNYSHPIKITIERNDIEFEQIIEAQFGMPYRMLPKVEYIVSTYYLNGTLIEEREVELDENNKIVPFGFYSEEVPWKPDQLINSYNNIIALIGLGVGIFLIVIGIVLYLSKKNREHKEKRKNYYLDHKLSPSSHTRNLGG